MRRRRARRYPSAHIILVDLMGYASVREGCAAIGISTTILYRALRREPIGDVSRQRIITALGPSFASRLIGDIS